MFGTKSTEQVRANGKIYQIEMIELRPHTLKYAVTTEGHENPVNGDWIPGVTTWSESVKCRYESNSKAIEIELPNGDGKVKKYAYVVYLNLDNEKNYMLGEHIRLFDQRRAMIAEKQVQGFHRGQLNMQIWL